MEQDCTCDLHNGEREAVGMNTGWGGGAVFMGVIREGFPEEVTLQLRAEEKQGAR